MLLFRVLTLTVCKVFGIRYPGFLEYIFQYLEFGSNQVIYPSSYVLYVPPKNLDQPLRIHLEGEKFNSKNHNRSFVERESCSVCYEGYRTGELVTYWPRCKHVFHTACLSGWTQNKETCPNCRRRYEDSRPVDPESH